MFEENQLESLSVWNFPIICFENMKVFYIPAEFKKYTKKEKNIPIMLDYIFYMSFIGHYY